MGLQWEGAREGNVRRRRRQKDAGGGNGDKTGIQDPEVAPAPVPCSCMLPWIRQPTLSRSLTGTSTRAYAPHEFGLVWAGIYNPPPSIGVACPAPVRLVPPSPLHHPMPPGTHQPQGRQEVLIELHEVDLQTSQGVWGADAVRRCDTRDVLAWLAQPYRGPGPGPGPPLNGTVLKSNLRATHYSLGHPPDGTFEPPVPPPCSQAHSAKPSLRPSPMPYVPQATTHATGPTQLAASEPQPVSRRRASGFLLGSYWDW